MNINFKFSIQLSADEELEYKNAKPMSEIPGPSKLELIRAFMPGGKLEIIYFLLKL